MPPSPQQTTQSGISHQAAHARRAAEDSRNHKGPWPGRAPYSPLHGSHDAGTHGCGNGCSPDHPAVRTAPPLGNPHHGQWLPYAGHLLCARHCYALSYTALGHTAIKHQGAKVNGKRDGRNQDLNPSLSLNHMLLTTKTFTR